jgi:hypothetical protein
MPYADYFDHVHYNTNGIVFRHLALCGTYILKGRKLHNDAELVNLLVDARKASRITHEQIIEVFDTDIVVTAEDDDGRKYVIAAEVSSTLDDSDITHAALCARIMGEATGYPHLGVAIAQAVAPQQRELAASEGVIIALTSDPNATRQRPTDWTTL